MTVDSTERRSIQLEGGRSSRGADRLGGDQSAGGRSAPGTLARHRIERADVCELGRPWPWRGLVGARTWAATIARAVAVLRCLSPSVPRAAGARPATRRVARVAIPRARPRPAGRPPATGVRKPADSRLRGAVPRETVAVENATPAPADADVVPPRRATPGFTWNRSAGSPARRASTPSRRRQAHAHHDPLAATPQRPALDHVRQVAAPAWVPISRTPRRAARVACRTLHNHHLPRWPRHTPRRADQSACSSPPSLRHARVVPTRRCEPPPPRGTTTTCRPPRRPAAARTRHRHRIAPGPRRA
jgi:hypothetical protein